MKTRLATSAIALSTVLAGPALADVTAMDVWSNQQALYEAMGATLNGELSGSELRNPELNIVLPQGAGSLQIKTDVIMVTQGSNGSTVLSYPSPMTMQVTGEIVGEGSVSLDMVMTHEGYTTVATGEPGDITYKTEGENLRVTFDDIDISSSDPVEFDIKGFTEVTGFESTSHVTEGNLITIESASQIGATNTVFSFTADNVTSQNTQTAGAMQTNGTLTLPVGGSDIMNLSQAFRNGLSLIGETSTEGSTSSALTTANGQVINRQETTTGGQTAKVGLDENGLAISATANDINTVMNQEMLFPGDIEFGIQTASIDYVVPLNASDDTQSFRMATSLQGIVLGDAIWGMIDPTAQLIRDPAEVTFDVTGNGTNGMDLLDIAALSQLSGPPPIEVDDVTIENLRISALGAEAIAQGAFTFDWSDFETIPGMARPEGNVTVNLNGANQLMDTLTAMGLIPEEELMMPRMMMGMFATPVGDDMLQSEIEVNDQGHVLANGQRLR